jgi:hypothetical protein
MKNEQSQHARDCPAGENILKLPGAKCDCGLEAHVKAKAKWRKEFEKGYFPWLDKTGRKGGGGSRPLVSSHARGEK